MAISIGIDAGKRRCVATLKQAGSRQILEQLSFSNSREGVMQLVEHARHYPETPTAVVESTGNYWIRLHDVLEENGINTLLANPVETKAIAKARLKDDKIDSNILADLLRADLVPESYVPDREHRELRQLARTRIDLVHNRTMFKEKIEAILAKYEFPSPPVRDIFSATGRAWLSSLDLGWVDRMSMDSYLAALATFDGQVERFTAKIASICNVNDDARLLMTMPGIDFVTALTILSEVVDVRRFSTPWKLVGYAGLAPSRRNSGEHRWSGGITREGSTWLRYAMVEAANTAIRHDPRLSSFYRRVAERRGGQKARVATAREMLVIVWHMLTKKEHYRTMNEDMVKRKYMRMARRARDEA